MAKKELIRNWKKICYTDIDSLDPQIELKNGLTDVVVTGKNLTRNCAMNAIVTARLIETAPELYATLCEIKTRLEHYQLENKTETELEQKIGALLKKIRGESEDK